LSEVDEKLFHSLFDNLFVPSPSTKPGDNIKRVQTGTQIATINARIGQSAFSESVKELYGEKCCFPGCTISDVRFLIASHIARWTDNEQLRGELGNGLCFCLIHDKAFEIGLFTIDSNFRVYVNPKQINQSNLASDLKAQHGKAITLGKILPLKPALVEHWTRVGCRPTKI
jgi:putative restriction endonuclease